MASCTAQYRAVCVGNSMVSVPVPGRVPDTAVYMDNNKGSRVLGTVPDMVPGMVGWGNSKGSVLGKVRVADKGGCTAVCRRTRGRRKVGRSAGYR